MKHSAGRGAGRLGQLPYLLVLCGAVAGLLAIRPGAHGTRSGTLDLAAVLLIAAAARALLPERWLRLLSSRRRLVDVAALGALGIGLLAAGLILSGAP